MAKSPDTIYIFDAVVADGGLFCVSYLDDRGRLAILVCNPVLRTIKLLPCFPGRWSDMTSQTGVMSTARLSMEYEVFIINDARHPHEPNAFHESKTNRWRKTSSMILPRNCFSHGLGICVHLCKG